MPKQDNQNNPEERADNFLAQYQEKYSAAIDDARKAATTTATEAWQTRYSDCVKTHKQAIAEHAREIEYELKKIKTGDATEDGVKAIRAAAKAMDDERIRHSAWWSRAVMPYENAAIACEGIITGAINGARKTEQQAALTAHGLSEAVRNRIAKWPRAQWDEETGVVTVTEPEYGAGEKVA